MKKVDISKHVLIPKHAKVTDKGKEELLKKYGITVDSLPKVLKDDPAIEALSAKEGDVIMIVRKSPTAGESVFYRVIANA